MFSFCHNLLGKKKEKNCTESINEPKDLQLKARVIYLTVLESVSSQMEQLLWSECSLRTPFFVYYFLHLFLSVSTPHLLIYRNNARGFFFHYFQKAIDAVEFLLFFKSLSWILCTSKRGRSHLVCF